MNGDLLRTIDAIRREKNIDAEIIFESIESALSSAAKKHYGSTEDVSIIINRESGAMNVVLNGQAVDPTDFGRIAAQTAKQVIIQKIREAERASIMEDYADQVGSIITGQVTRVEYGNAVVSLGRGEGFLPRSEQVPGETLHVGDRIRAIIIDVRESGANVKIVLSRTHPDLIIRLFELEVPEVADRIIVIEDIAREPGHRTKVAVSSIDSRVDAVGACVGIRGSRIKNIVEEVAGEKIDIVRYNESPQVYMANSLKPAEVKEVLLNRDIKRASVLVAEDQLSLAIGKKGQNVRLAHRLTGWHIDIMTPGEYEQQRVTALDQLSSLPSVGSEMAGVLVDAGYISIADVAEVPAEVLVNATGLEPEQTGVIVQECAALVRQLEAEAAKAAEAEAARAAAAEAEEAEAGEAEEAGESDVQAEGDLAESPAEEAEPLDEAAEEDRPAKDVEPDASAEAPEPEPSVDEASETDEPAPADGPVGGDKSAES